MCNGIHHPFQIRHYVHHWSNFYIYYLYPCHQTTMTSTTTRKYILHTTSQLTTVFYAIEHTCSTTIYYTTITLYFSCHYIFHLLNPFNNNLLHNNHTLFFPCHYIFLTKPIQQQSATQQSHYIFSHYCIFHVKLPFVAFLCFPSIF